MPSPTKLSWSAVLAWRMRRQHLAERSPRRSMFDVVADIAGLHAQLLTSAELTLWARVSSLERGAVDKALWEDRTLVKTWAMRGTLHLLPAHELSLWVAAQSMQRPRYHAASWLRYFELTRKQADALMEAIPRALEGRVLTREELAREVGRLTSPALGEKLRESWGALLKPAAFRGELCFAPNAGRNVRFARPQDWLGPSEPVGTDDAVREVVRRYLSAYGPATREDFARWFGQSPAQAERMIKLLGEDVSLVELDGSRAWILSDLAGKVGNERPRGIVRLLPAFDQYVVAAPRDSEAVLPQAYRSRVYRPQGWLSPVVLVDGQISGTWKHDIRRDRVDVQIEPFAQMAKRERHAAEAEAERLAHFLGTPLELRW